MSRRTVDTHVRGLRIELGSHAGVITTIRGRGYRFDAGTDVRYVPAGQVPGLNRLTASP